MLWYASERTVSIHSIHTFRREVFYWLTVFAIFALVEIDRNGDYRPLKQLIIKGIVTSYRRLVAAKKKAMNR